MAPKGRIDRYARWYARLLWLFPPGHRSRFGAEMEQVFRDCLADGAAEGKTVGGLAAMMFADTAIAAVRERMTMPLIPLRSLFRITGIVAAILAIPLVAMQITPEVNWTAFDFAVAGTALFLAGLAFDILARSAADLRYRSAAAIAVGAPLVLLWINGAVGIGSDSDIPNGLYLLIPAFGVAGAILAQLRAAGMAAVLTVMAAVHVLIGTTSLVFQPVALSTGEVREIVGVTIVFGALFLTSAWLFRHPAPPRTASA